MNDHYLIFKEYYVKSHGDKNELVYWEEGSGHFSEAG